MSDIPIWNFLFLIFQHNFHKKYDHNLLNMEYDFKNKFPNILDNDNFPIYFHYNFQIISKKVRSNGTFFIKYFIIKKLPLN